MGAHRGAGISPAYKKLNAKQNGRYGFADDLYVGGPLPPSAPTAYLISCGLRPAKGALRFSNWSTKYRDRWTVVNVTVIATGVEELRWIRKRPGHPWELMKSIPKGLRKGIIIHRLRQLKKAQAAL